jgi:uncharacterized membrane protein (DUF4010 family)
MNVVAGLRIVGVVLLATLAMYLRNIAILALFAPRALFTAMGPLLAMAIVSLLLLTGKRDDEPGRELALTSPISLRRVLSYAILFLAIQVISTLAERLFGNLGFIAASGISGMASSASATAAAANLSAGAKIAPALAGTAVVIASMASTLTNLPILFKRLSRSLQLKIVFSTTLQIATGLAVLAVQRFLVFR